MTVYLRDHPCTFVIYCLTVIVLDKFRGGHELVPGRELVHHHYRFTARVSLMLDVINVRQVVFILSGFMLLP